jgi:restriction system protein
MNQSGTSDRSDSSDQLLPKHGGYRKLRSFQAAQLVYDATLVFCNRFIEKRSRTHDQMVQAARSGAQNIAEGSMASGTSKKTELKLTNVARSSLEELLLDYEDFLRQRSMRLWDKDSSEAMAVRQNYLSENSSEAVSSATSKLKTAGPEVAANLLLCLINQASYLLRRQLKRLEQDFLQHGGFTERLYEVRNQARQRQAEQPSRALAKSGLTQQSNLPPPACPRCGKPMVQRTAQHGPSAGQLFWGCSTFPNCKGTRAANQSNLPTSPPPPI